MEKIAVTGGKGGTGKSTVSILLANKLRKRGKVVLVDCDVECPNDYLLLSQKLIEPRKKVFAQFPKLDKSKCIKCGLCVKNCRSNAIFQAPEKYPVFFHELCSGCGLCWHLCPQKAIKIEKKVTGEIFESRIDDNFLLITGRSVGVVDETGPIVSELMAYALKRAKKVKTDFLLIDTAVGLHCGVIRALLGADLAYAVTEPTPLGAHDLELVLELLETLKVSTKIVLNQTDLGKRELIDEIAQKAGLEIKYEIPYSKELVKAYSAGKLDKLNLL
jgi:MinD superfamily P-loop ATPase